MPQIQQLNMKLRPQDKMERWGGPPLGLLKGFRWGCCLGYRMPYILGTGAGREQQWGMDDLGLARAYDQVMSGAIKAQSVSVCICNPTVDCSGSLEIKPPLKNELFFFKNTR